MSSVGRVGEQKGGTRATRNGVGARAKPELDHVGIIGQEGCDAAAVTITEAREYSVLNARTERLAHGGNADGIEIRKGVGRNAQSVGANRIEAHEDTLQVSDLGVTDGVTDGV